MIEVTEMCPYCGREVSMFWGIEADGYKAFCPYCGERLMLCGECSDCDYDSRTDTCKHNRKEVMI